MTISRERKKEREEREGEKEKISCRFQYKQANYVWVYKLSREIVGQDN